VKTITIDEEAYLRLKAWKRSPKDSFSQVIRRTVPEAGTVAAFKNFVESNRTDLLPNNEDLENAIESRSSAKPDAWTL
jgi:predicted CopG family antitoxin